MQTIQLQPLRRRTRGDLWIAQVFDAKAARQGGVVRRAVDDVEREVGRDVFIAAVAARDFHLIECAGQFIVICRTDRITVHR